MIKTPKQIGSTIRDLRKKRNITGVALGTEAGLSQSKISKIEAGIYSQLKYAEIEKILNILQAPSTIRQQVLRAVDETAHSNNRGIPFTNIRFILPDVEMERQARLIRMYMATAIPASLQTASYRAASLRYKGVEEENLDILIKNTMARQDLLWDSKRIFNFILPETVLYTLAGSRESHIAQLDRLERFADIPNVKLGIIPVEAGTILIEYTTFALYDEHTLFQAIGRHEIKSRDKQDIEFYGEVFSSLQELAHYDGDAVRLIRKAIDYFS
jgi:transcriptional regulator with XRE-family HTH domain